MITRLLATVLLAFVATACRTPPPANTVIAYLDRAEIQAETRMQLDNLRRVLSDLQGLSPDLLKLRRYADMQGRPGVRSFDQVLAGHLVPRRPQAIVPDRFLSDLKDPAAQEMVRATLRRVEAAVPGRK